MSSCAGRGRALQPEPIEAMRTKCQEVRQLADWREWCLTDELDRLPAVIRAEIELRWLHEPRLIDHAEQNFVAIGPDIGQDSPIVSVQELERPSSESPIPLSDTNDAAHPFQQRCRQTLLRFDIDRLKPIDGVGDDRLIQPGRISS